MPKIEAEVPSPAWLDAHNSRFFQWVIAFSLLFVVFSGVMGWWVIFTGSLFMAGSSFLLKQAVCGWVHTFAAYCVAIGDERIEISE